jgi:hypothetical protein
VPQDEGQPLARPDDVHAPSLGANVVPASRDRIADGDG